MADNAGDDSRLWFFEERSGADADTVRSDAEQTQVIPAVAAPAQPEKEGPAPPQESAARQPAARPNQPEAAGPSQYAEQATPLQPRPQPTDTPRTAAPAFAVVLRGYDKAAVDSFVERQQYETAVATAQSRAASQEVARLQGVVAELERQLSEMGEPTYGGLGTHAAALLRIAEEQATNVTVEAQEAADQSRSLVEAEVAALRADAEKEASDSRAVTMRETEQRRESVLAEAQQERSAAHAEAADLLAAAQRQAEQVTLAARQQAAALLQGAKREAEQARAAADREAAESRRVLAVERERMAKEATDRHSTAGAETARLVEEAEARASAADSRTQEAIATASRHREETLSAADESLGRARREADQIVSAARTQAGQIVTNATSDVDRRVGAARAQLSVLQKRRDGIMTQLSQLRDLVASFGQPDEVLDIEAPIAPRPPPQEDTPPG